MKKVSVFGSTGFVGERALQILRENSDDFEVSSLIANSNAGLLASQARVVNAKSVAIADKDLYNELKELLSGTNIKVVAGREGVRELASERVDSAVVAVSGVAALEYVLDLIQSGVGCIALASKESIVCGGSLLIDTAKERGTHIVPLDSEHNAIYRVLQGKDGLEKVIITASGGPFLHYTIDQMRYVTPGSALAHPVWKMGKKISIDSATMANKALEIIEARYFFSLERNEIDVVVHPESIVHAIATYADGVSIALMSVPDMAIPILHSLYWPDKRGIYRGDKLDLLAQGQLTFMKPDLERFPALRIGLEIAESPVCHSSGIVFNAANEVAVEAFLNGRIGFLEIVKVVLAVMGKISCKGVSSFGDIMEYDLMARDIASVIMNEKQFEKFSV